MNARKDSLGGRTARTLNGEASLAAVRWVVDARIFDELKFHGNTTWKPVDLILLTAVWAWSEASTLTGAFDEAHRWSQQALSRAAVNLLDVFYIRLRQRMSTAGFEAAKLLVANSVVELIGRVREAYYNLQAAVARDQFMQTVTAARDASFDLARRLHEAGNITDLQLDDEESLYRQAEIDLERIKAVALTARQALALLMGTTDLETWEVTEHLPALPKIEISVENLEKDALDKNLTLAATRQSIEVLKARGVLAGLAPSDDAEAGGALSREDSRSLNLHSFTVVQVWPKRSRTR